MALTQVRFPVRPKLEMARNYWDEMGRGNPRECMDLSLPCSWAAWLSLHAPRTLCLRR